MAYSGTSDISKKQLLDYFSTEIALLKLPLSFDILWSSYGKFSVKNVNGTEDIKTFSLGRFDIEYLGDNVFNVQLYFVLTCDNETYSNRVSLNFFDGGSFVVFKTDNGKIKFKLPDEIVELHQIDKGFRIYRYFPEETFEIPVKNGEVFLKVRKKR
ncbi:hypothetical protein [Desulfurobacterium atlanticum]|uniref:hypothetical protein n=1 Tax=Desulfurobacterium atlanticum TaxID=240169 RepID=UPI001C5D1EE8|nr:hypothetical protein [Desulfurobacterium atlanticum]